MSIRRSETALPGLVPGSLLFLAALLAGCAATPGAETDRGATPAAFVQDSGLVIGTVSYNYAGGAHPRVVHFERLDRAPQADYALAVSVDDANQRGVFTGTLPAGVYSFREAESAERHFAANGVKMPFEVQAGAVQDAGHYALSPDTGR